MSLELYKSARGAVSRRPRVSPGQSNESLELTRRLTSYVTLILHDSIIPRSKFEFHAVCLPERGVRRSSISPTAQYMYHIGWNTVTPTLTGRIGLRTARSCRLC